MAAKIDEILKPIASELPVDSTINILNPLIATGRFPTNLYAIKLLTELVTNQSEEITDVHIDNVMPNVTRVNIVYCYLLYINIILLHMLSIHFLIEYIRFKTL